MFCRNFCGNVPARDDGKRGTERVSNDRSESDNVYILHIKRKVSLAGGNARMDARLQLTWAAANMIVAI